MRAVLWACSLAVVLCGACSSGGSGNGSNYGRGAIPCEQAGGQCSPTTPGACLGQYVGDPGQYYCGEGDVCCLPLSATPCERAGGLCVEPDAGACANGTVGDASTYSCATNGGPVFECCLPAADAGT